MIGFRVLLMVALLAAGLVIPGPWGSLAFCLAPVAGVACLFAIGDHVARDWFMHALTLHELIRPRYESAADLFADWTTAGDDEALGTNVEVRSKTEADRHGE